MTVLTPSDKMTASVIINWLESRNLNDVASLLRSRLSSQVLTGSDNPISYFDSDMILQGIHSILTQHLDSDKSPTLKRQRSFGCNERLIDGFLFSNTESATPDFQKALDKGTETQLASKIPALDDKLDQKRTTSHSALISFKQNPSNIPSGPILNESFPPVAAIKNKAVHLFDDHDQNAIPPISSHRLTHSDSLLTFGATALIVDNVLHDQNTVDLEQFLDDLHQNA